MKHRELVVTVVAIAAIAYLERLALLMGIDGAMLALAVAVIGGLAGYELRGWRSGRRSK